MPKSKSPFTLDLLDSYRHIADAQIHPNGSCVAFVNAALTHPPGKNPRANIWLVPTGSGEPRPFTNADAYEAHPRWSPDGEWLAFVSDRIKNDVFHLYRIPRDGGEAIPLTQGQGIQEPYRDVSMFSWSPDGKQIAFLQRDPPDPAQRADGHDEIEFEAEPRFTRVRVLDLAAGETRTVTHGDVQVWELDWAPDGQELVVLCSRLPYEWAWYDVFLARVPARGGKPRKIWERPGRQLAHPRYSPDGSSIAVVSSALSDRGIVSGDVYVVDRAGKHSRNLSENSPASFGGLRWTDPHHLISVGYIQGEAALFELDVEGGVKPLWRDNLALQESYTPKFSRSQDGTIAVVRSAPKEPREVWTANLSDADTGVWMQLTSLNAGLKEVTTGEHQVIHWNSVDGAPMQGIVVTPTGKRAKKLPTVVLPHGGPTSITANEYFPPTRWVYHLTARGFAVFMPNYRGSTGWGVSFSQANLGDMGGMDWHDIESGVDTIIARGIADPKRLGFGGWSYGGFLTAWAITQTNRYKAAVAGAAVTNWLSFHGTSYLSAWDQSYMEDDPYATGGNYDRFSPMRHIRNAKTSTLILHGAKDEDVPVTQGHELYRALRELGVETELVIYPREPHTITETEHVKDLITRVCGWFERHLK